MLFLQAPVLCFSAFCFMLLFLLLHENSRASLASRFSPQKNQNVVQTFRLLHSFIHSFISLTVSTTREEEERWKLKRSSPNPTTLKKKKKKKNERTVREYVTVEIKSDTAFDDSRDDDEKKRKIRIDAQKTDWSTQSALIISLRTNQPIRNTSVFCTKAKF